MDELRVEMGGTRHEAATLRVDMFGVTGSLNRIEAALLGGPRPSPPSTCRTLPSPSTARFVFSAPST